jgi:hypothetical protein
MIELAIVRRLALWAGGVAAQQFRPRHSPALLLFWNGAPRSGSGEGLTPPLRPGGSGGTGANGNSEDTAFMRQAFVLRLKR